MLKKQVKKENLGNSSAEPPKDKAELGILILHFQQDGILQVTKLQRLNLIISFVLSINSKKKFKSMIPF